MKTKFFLIESDVVQDGYPSIRDEFGTLVAVFCGYEEDNLTNPNDARDKILALARAKYCLRALNK